MSQAEASDRELVERAQRGDKAAFAQLVERYQRRVYAVAYGMLHNRDDAQDVVQDAFVKAHRHLSAFQGNASFYTWLYRIVANLCIDVRRKRGRRPEVAFDETIKPDAPISEGIGVTPRHPEANPLDNLSRRELGREIERALETLSDKHRTILLLREIEGLAYEDLARVLKISKGTVMSRLFHARKNMQKALRPYLGVKELPELDPEPKADASAAETVARSQGS